jgi:nucleotide-binding universal stress UspA family protein
MALKDLLVYVDQSDRAGECLRLAAELAGRHRSRLTAIYMKEKNAAQLHEQGIAELSRGSPDAMSWTKQHIEEAIDGTAERLRASLKGFEREYDLEVEWRCLSGEATAVVPRHARFADLCILSQDISTADCSTDYTFSEKMLFVTGRPMVLIPASGSFESLGRHILIAWNSSRASTRAVNDALAVIERSDKVTVLAVNPEEYAKRYRSLPPERLVENLRRHGAATQAVSLHDVPSASIASAVLAEAHKLNADLIVAGAFGQPRLWEKLMGGVTRDLLAGMTLPILMSY